MCDNATNNAILILNRTNILPEFILRNFSLHFPAAYLLIKCIEELLPRRRSGEYSALILLTAKVAQVKYALMRTVERDAHTVKHLNEFWRSLDHSFDSELIRKEVTAVYRIIKMLVNTIVFALCVHTGIHAALCTE